MFATKTCPAGTPWCVRHDGDPWRGMDPESTDYACRTDAQPVESFSHGVVELTLFHLSDDPAIIELGGVQYTAEQALGLARALALHLRRLGVEVNDL